MRHEHDFVKSLDTALYLNRWVAVVRERVIGVGLTRQQAYHAAKRIRPKDKAALFFINSEGQPRLMDADKQILKIRQGLDKYKLLRETIEILRTRQIDAYLVGGAVRDLLLGREKIVDFDFAVPSDGVTVARQVADKLKAAFYPLDPERGTGRVVCDTEPPFGPPQVYLDFATFRGPTLEADLVDRDFTINAIALDVRDPLQLIDPMQGQLDLVSGQIRATSAHAFAHDPVRVLRAIRQAVGFGFSIETSTKQYLTEAIPQLNIVSPERQRDELIKLLNTPAPGQAVRLLHQLAVLPKILPEIQALVGVNQSTPHHLDVFDHTVAALDAWPDILRTGWSDIPEQFRAGVEQQMNELLAGNLPQRMLMPLALMLHDTGKPHTSTEETVDGEMKIRFLRHEQESAKIARRVMRRFYFSRQATDFVETVVAHHMRPLLLSAEGKVSRRAIYRFFRDTGGATYQAGLAVALHAIADHRATYPSGQGRAEEQTLLNIVHQLIVAYFEQQDQIIDPPPLLTGRELIETFGLSEGRLIGLILKRLKEAQATGQITDRAEAIDFVKADPDFASYQGEDL